MTSQEIDVGSILAEASFDRALDVSNHKFPAEVALELLQHIPDGVTEVRCSGLRMSNFPTFSGTARLQSLICAENYLTTATFDGSIFASLVRLDLSRNHLSELPISDRKSVV